MIGLIDSGTGAVNIMYKCACEFCEDFVCLCDNKNAPYGNKSKQKLFLITKSNIDFLINNYKCDVVILACNTLSFCVYEQLKNLYNIPILRMEINEEKINKLKKEILFFATKNTIKNNLIINKKINNKKIYSSLFIRNLPILIDNNLNNIYLIKNKLKKELNKNKYNKINTIILGCTHYFAIKNLIKEIRPSWQIYEYDIEVVNKAKNLVKKKSKSSFKIVLTKYDYNKFQKTKKYFENLFV